MNCFSPSRHSRRGRSAHAVAARTGEHAGERADADAGLPCAGTVAGRVSHRELQQLLPALGGDLSTAPAPLRSMGFWGGAGSCAGLRIRSSILALSARLTSSARWACSTVGTTACCFCHAVARQVAGYMDVCTVDVQLPVKHLPCLFPPAPGACWPHHTACACKKEQ
jgi:hypothetical protein